MKRRHRLACAFLLLGTTSAVLAQGGITPTPVSVASTCKNCCSIFDLLGTKQLGKFLDQNVMKSRLGQAILTVFSPIGRALGLGPSLLSDKFAKSTNPAMKAANAAKKDKKEAPLKVQAIRYLATVDCNCYKEVVPALLASLDECVEVVRYEALKALHKKCDEGKKKCKKGKACNSDGNEIEPDGCDCGSCQCRRDVLARLNLLLLERDESGCLKEKSERVRDLATLMIEECLVRHEPPPVDEVVPNVDPDRRVPEVVPRPPVPDPRPAPRPDARPGVTPDERRSPPSPLSPVNPDEKTRRPAGSTTTSGASIPEAGVAKGAKDSSAQAKSKTQPGLLEYVVDKTTSMVGGSSTDSTAAPGKLKPKDGADAAMTESAPPAPAPQPSPARRHLMGEIFGYRK